VFDIDTHLGKVRFFLSLDTIASESGIADDKCLDKFDEISKQLREKFGVRTRFRAGDEKSDGKLRQKGELELPDEGGTLERSA
jgi:hypothetical protein